MTKTETTSHRYAVSSYDRSHYVTDTRTGQFIGLGFSSKKRAQAKVDEKNGAVK